MDKSILSKRHKEDCLACRVVSGCGLLGMGLYVWHHSKRRASPIGRYSMVGIGAVAALIGTSRLFNLYPFNSNTNVENEFYIRDNSIK